MTFLNLFKRISTLNQPVLENPKVDENNLTYRERLAETIAGLETYGETGKALADVFLMREKFTEDYLSTMGKDEVFGREETIEFVKEGNVELVFKYREHFGGISYEELLDYLNNRGNYRINEFLEYFYKFEGLNYEDTLLKIYERHGDHRIFKKFMEKGNGFTEKTIKLLADHQEGKIVIDNLDKFRGLTTQEISDKLVDCDYGYLVVDNLDKFPGIDRQKLVDKLIEAGCGHTIIEKLDKFPGIDHQKLVYKLIEVSCGDTVVDNLDKFLGIDYDKLVDKLIENGLGVLILKNIEKFECANLSEKIDKIVKQLMLMGNEEKVLFLKFIPGEYHEEIINKINTNKYRELSNLRFYSKDDLKCKLTAEITERLIDEGLLFYNEDVIKCIDKFENLNPRIAEKFIKRGYVDIVLEYPEKFGLEKKKKQDK